MTLADSCFCGAHWNLPAKECSAGHYMTASEFEAVTYREALRRILNESSDGLAMAIAAAALGVPPDRTEG